MKTDVHQESEFLEMLRDCRGTILRVCYSFTDHGREDFRDLYQEIVCTLWKCWPAFRGESSANTWATRIALNVAGQEARRRKRMPQFLALDESMYDLLSSEACDERIQRMQGFLDRLDDAEETKLLFLYLDGKPLKEVAAIAGLTEPATRQKLYRIRLKLKKMKGEEDE